MSAPRLRSRNELRRQRRPRHRSCVHWVGRDVESWLDAQRTAGSIIVAVELADEASRLADQTPARRVEIPMVGTGASLNVAVAGSLVLYRLAGLI